MLRILLANGVFAGIIWGFWIWCGGDRTVFLPALVLAGIAYCVGLTVGLMQLSGRRTSNPSRRRGNTPIDVGAFDQIQ